MTDNNDITSLLERDNQREAELARHELDYDPATGAGSPIKRVAAAAPKSTRIAGKLFLPPAMLDDPEWKRVRSRRDFDLLRFRYDFEYWAVTCVKIRDKATGRRIPFRLNAPQRRFAAMLEADRTAGRPLRFIMLKARQWGGSALCYLLIYLESAMNQPNGLLLKMFNTNMTVDYLCTLHYFSISSSLISPIRVVSIWLTHIQASTISHSSS